MNWVDIVILSIIGLSILTGVIRGFLKELIALTIWVLAIWLAYRYSNHLDTWLGPYISDKTARSIIGFGLILVGTLVVGGVINILIGILMRHSGLSATDRFLGLFFGFARGVFIVVVLFSVAQMTSIPKEEYTKDSILYPEFEPLVRWLNSKMPNLIKQARLLDSNQTFAELTEIN